MIRIVGGKYRHLTIDVPNVSRPTTDKTREALMSIIQNDIEDKMVLDLFAGSGGFGIECLSRGAKECYFVDNSYEAIKIIKSNLKKLKVEEATKVIKASYKQALENFNKDNIKFDIVFMDPPYKNKEFYSLATSYLKNNHLLNEGAIIIKESDVLLDIDDEAISSKRYKYGISHILLERY